MALDRSISSMATKRRLLLLPVSFLLSRACNSLLCYTMKALVGSVHGVPFKSLRVTPKEQAF